MLATISERPLNGLEDLFAACNVRFALLVDLKDTAGLTKAKESADAAARSCRLGHLALQKNNGAVDEDDGNWTLLTDTSNESASVAPVTVVATEAVALDGDDCGSFLDKIMREETLPAKGPMSIQLIPYKKNQQKEQGRTGIMLYVNGNHAICDGRSLTHLVATMMAEMTGDHVDKEEGGVDWRTITLPDWKDMVEQALVAKNLSPEEPPYLMGPNNSNLLAIKELCTEQTSTGNESFRFELSHESVSRLRQVLKEKATGATLTGFLVAAIMQCLAMEYTGNVARDIGVSVLVDLRPHLLLDRPTTDKDEQINQAHGTVTLMDSTDNINIGDEDTSTSNLFARSIDMTRQLRTRIERGEAHRSALAVTRGHFDERAGPPATIELSNLGLCPIAAPLYTAQRFDGYDGVSCMIHSEPSSCMRWNASVGQGLDAKMVERVFSRTVELCRTTAN